ncbi:MAG: polysaccharide deacetylase family protein [Bacteroidetes bacterium]|nr:polysaccharide deacetylase family protein [Bacteroidota bacterium]
MLLIYSPGISNRLSYVCEFIFTRVCITDYELTGNRATFGSHAGPKLCYDEHALPGCLHIAPHGLLNRQTLDEIRPEVTEWDIMRLFPTQGALGYDVFSAVFYMISRYEEWLSFTPDKHNRFEAQQSILYKHKQLHKPLVDLWCMELKEALCKLFPSLEFRARSFQYISTIDVDNNYAYLGKPGWRMLGASVRDLIKGNRAQIKQRRAVRAGKQPDPFADYTYQVEWSRQQHIPLIYFFLTIHCQTEFDRALPCHHPLFKTMIDTVKGKATIGLHPSYFSDQGHTLHEEKKNLEQLAGQSVSHSRQHYLHFDIRRTPALLIAIGIRKDYTMGFASHDGFRAGTCTPFFYFDLQKNEATELEMVPFCMMDSVYYDYLKLPTAQALSRMQELADEVKKVNGTLVSVWHDRSFSELHFPGWKKQYETLHHYIRS